MKQQAASSDIAKTAHLQNQQNHFMNGQQMLNFQSSIPGGGVGGHTSQCDYTMDSSSTPNISGLDVNVNANKHQGRGKRKNNKRNK